MSESGNKSAEQLEREAEFLKKEIEGVEDVIRSEEKIKHDLEKHELEEEARREREKHDHDHGHGHFVRITMVVNGQPVVVEAEPQEKLAEVRQKALKETQNLAQPPENWEIKDEAGTLLDPEKRVAEYHFGKEVTLFLSLKAGAAG
ncbi:putative ATPase [Bradyrhizobium sp. USDA 4524]